MDSGRGLRNDQSDRSLPRGTELNLDFINKITRARRMVPLTMLYFTLHAYIRHIILYLPYRGMYSKITNLQKCSVKLLIIHDGKLN